MQEKTELDEDGTKYWHLNGVLHRESGPAIERLDGTKEWYLHGKRHRENGPAIECANGSTGWWSNDNLHRVNGPAIEYSDGKSEYWYKGKKISEKEYLSKEFQVKMVMEE